MHTRQSNCAIIDQILAHIVIREVNNISAAVAGDEDDVEVNDERVLDGLNGPVKRKKEMAPTYMELLRQM